MRLLLTTLALLCALAVLASPAGADTTIATTGAQLTITAAPGTDNAVTIGAGDRPGTVRVEDAGDALTLDDPACLVVTPPAPPTAPPPIRSRSTWATGTTTFPPPPRPWR